MSRGTPPSQGLIGPNAILQFLPVLDNQNGPEWREGLLLKAGVPDIPDGQSMIPETDAARVHKQVRLDVPDLAPDLARQAGIATADYILKHRIPPPVQWLLKALPARSAAAVLSRAIARHAWTFIGSGQLRVADPWTYKISGNPLIANENSDVCLCHWHEAVFARLYQTLVASTCTCQETSCGAQGNGHICRFELHR
ncbi:bacteriochlorophyll 4-vinyl reductase [Roseovarius sp. 2305UL8-3]|uniref:bacteriochlorophyll 4-vinyl reductase n=1 Tax=Roseovarius conchicola TaxID=3121636 RepID=UPI003529191F